MTDFLTWWLDHWPLAVVAIPLLVAYPIIFYELQWWWAEWRMKWTDGV